MFNKSICLILSLVYLLLEILLNLLSLKIDFLDNGFLVLIFVLLDVVTPILLYYFYFNSAYSKIVAFILPFFTSVSAWLISALFYHTRTNFIYYNNPELGTGLSFGIFCAIHIVSAVIFTILSFLVK